MNFEREALRRCRCRAELHPECQSQHGCADSPVPGGHDSVLADCPVPREPHESELEGEETISVQRDKRPRSPSPRRRRRHRREVEQRRINRQRWIRTTPSRAPATSTCSVVRFPKRPWSRPDRHRRSEPEEVEEIPDTEGAAGSTDPAPIAPPLPHLGQLSDGGRTWSGLRIPLTTMRT